MLIDAGLDALTNGELVALLGLGGDRTDSRTREGDEGRIVGVERLGDDYLVALVENARQSHLQSLGAAGGDEHLLIGDGSADLAVVVDDSVDHHGHAVGRSVSQNGLGEVLDRLKISSRSGDVGLADVQMIQLLAVFDGLVCIGSKLAHGGKTAFFDLAGKLHFVHPFTIFGIHFFYKLQGYSITAYVYIQPKTPKNIDNIQSRRHMNMPCACPAADSLVKCE